LRKEPELKSALSMGVRDRKEWGVKDRKDNNSFNANSKSLSEEKEGENVHVQEEAEGTYKAGKGSSFMASSRRTTPKVKKEAIHCSERDCSKNKMNRERHPGTLVNRDGKRASCLWKGGKA